MKKKIGTSVIVRNEEQFNKLKSLIGTESLYLDWVPQMGEVETSVVLKAYKYTDFSSGSVGRASYHKDSGLELVEFDEYFKGQ